MALFTSVVMLGPALAHLFELPAKIGLQREQYFIVQQIYRGWDLFGIVLLVQVVSLLAVAWLARREPRVIAPTVLAIVFVAAAQVLFWTYTYPANVATMNWTVQPDNWETLRREWEYSHAIGACLQLAAMTCLFVAVISRSLTRRVTAYHVG